MKLMGFVYVITHNETQKSYIGKKTFWSHRKLKPSDKRRTTVESDWRVYCGSNKEVQLLFKKNPSHFTRTILYLCTTKYGMSYNEDRLLYAYNVLEHPDLFFNDNIACKYFISKFDQWYRPAASGVFPKHLQEQLVHNPYVQQTHTNTEDPDDHPATSLDANANDRGRFPNTTLE